MKSSRAATITTRPTSPKPASMPSTLSTAAWKARPSPIATPTKRLAPIASSSTNTGSATCVCPDSAVEIGPRPGMNLATTSVHTPQRENSVCVWRTHESGEIESRQTVRSTRPP